MPGVQLDGPLSEEERIELTDSIARQIVARGLETPAVLLIEMHKPLSFVASQAALVAMPFLAPFVGARNMANLSRLLADRANVDALIARIEDMAAERDLPQPLLPKEGSEEVSFPPFEGGTEGGNRE